MISSRLVSVLAVALLLSLAVNIYSGGVVLGRMASDAPPSCARTEWRQRDAQLRERLSAQDYAIVKKHKDAKRAKFKKERAELRRAREAVDSAMRAEPFDSKQLEAVIAQESAVKLRVLQSMHESRQALGQVLSSEGQAVFFEVMRQPRKHSGGAEE